MALLVLLASLVVYLVDNSYWFVVYIGALPAFLYQHYNLSMVAKRELTGELLIRKRGNKIDYYYLTLGGLQALSYLGFKRQPSLIYTTLFFMLFFSSVILSFRYQRRKPAGIVVSDGNIIINEATLRVFQAGNLLSVELDTYDTGIVFQFTAGKQFVATFREYSRSDLLALMDKILPMSNQPGLKVDGYILEKLRPAFPILFFKKIGRAIKTALRP
ncbi:MAG TPA: hypothetical protein VHB48_04880 [Chitinophagaceae bacterium]|nr:hypothetical protein [Chitinophagaceae bacterium]